MVLGPTVAGGGPKLDAQPAWHALVVVRVFGLGSGYPGLFTGWQSFRPEVQGISVADSACQPGMLAVTAQLLTSCCSCSTDSNCGCVATQPPGIDCSHI
jgi:hypothetical protein